MDGVEEEERADALVEVVARAPELLERGGFVEELMYVGAAREERFERSVADRRIGGGDDPGEPGCRRSGYHRASSRWARRSSSRASTTSRSLPERASASCAVSSPYLTPTSKRRAR